MVNEKGDSDSASSCHFFSGFLSFRFGRLRRGLVGLHYRKGHVCIQFFKFFGTVKCLIS